MSTDFVYFTIESVGRPIRLRNELAELDRRSIDGLFCGHFVCMFVKGYGALCKST